MPKSKLKIEVIDGGVIKITSEGAVTAGAVHTSAENIIRAIREDAGGPSKVTSLKKGGVAAHSHTHADGTTHSH